MTVTALLGELAGIGRNPVSGGYDRLAWTAADAECRAWFRQSAASLGLDVETDRNGNLWAWWHPELEGAALVVGSHLDSVPSGGPYDGPLGVASAFAAVAVLQADGVILRRPVAIVAFADEEGARFGLACAGSRLMTGALDADLARGLRDLDGTSLAEAMTAAGQNPGGLGSDAERLGRIGEFIELHVEQGHLPTNGGAAGIGAAGARIGLADQIWPHGRWRVDVTGQQNHAGTTPIADRRDPMIGLAQVILSVRAAAVREDALATVGKVRVRPGAVNAIPAAASAWIDARAADEQRIRWLVDEVERTTGLHPVEESWTAATVFDRSLVAELAPILESVTDSPLPVLASGAGHDAGVLALAGVPTAMILVRNPSGISHSPEEYVDDVDCELGALALAEAIRARTAAPTR
ncbi:MAG TPA: allantoate amidohydrolase [Lacisediminihabitans sp.]|uniref:allantoate amidohydrolase n=1 Tax=Lacisediminihabitans sp. TaxID=2787631 RepID=UPI002EDA3D7E